MQRMPAIAAAIRILLDVLMAVTICVETLEVAPAADAVAEAAANALAAPSVVQLSPGVAYCHAPFAASGV